MEYNQFRQLLQLKGIREKETVSQLEDFIEKFPYCQTSRLLLAKALHDQNSVHYDRSLKLAAAYASNREVLRNLIEKRMDEKEFEFPLPKKDVVNEVVNETPLQTSVQAEKKEERFEEWYSENEISGRAFIEQKEKEKLEDPHEVIRKRLNEILSGVETPLPSIESSEENLVKTESIVPDIPAVSHSAPEPVAKEEVQIPGPPEEKIVDTKPETAPVKESKEDAGSESKIVAQAEQVRDVLDKMELEHAMEESILESLTKLPIIAPEKKFVEKIPDAPVNQDLYADKHSPRSFTDWLKVIQTGSSGFEEVHAPVQKPISKPVPEMQVETHEPEAEHESHLSDDELIEKFLLEDPKIVPSKAEFYSPVNQAKKSVMDHDDVVSETLAKIYLLQGNTRKARWCYQRLMLLHPEKSAFFAALLKEIDDQPTNKEDL